MIEHRLECVDVFLLFDEQVFFRAFFEYVELKGIWTVLSPSMLQMSGVMRCPVEVQSVPVPASINPHATTDVELMTCQMLNSVDAALIASLFSHTGILTRTSYFIPHKSRSRRTYQAQSQSY